VYLGDGEEGRGGFFNRKRRGLRRDVVPITTDAVAIWGDWKNVWGEGDVYVINRKKRKTNPRVKEFYIRVEKGKYNSRWNKS